MSAEARASCSRLSSTSSVRAPVELRCDDVHARARRVLADADRRGDRARDQRRVRHGGERHEPRPVREAVRDRRRELEGEPRLAGPAGSGEGHEPRGLEQRAQLVELPLAADERRQLDGQVVRPRVERPDRREVLLQARDDELLDALRLEVLEAVGAERPEPDAVGERPGREVGRGLGQEDLAAVPGRGHACCAMDVAADIAAVRVELPEAPVDPRPDADLRVAGPRLRGERRAARPRSSRPRPPRSGTRRRTSRPRCRSRRRRGRRATPGSARGGARGAGATRPFPRVSTRRVDPSMSVNRKAISPVSGWGVAMAGATAAPRSGGPR